MMCMRFEAKHQEIKAYTNVSSNRRNVCMSAGRKFAFKFANFLLNKETLTRFFEDFKEWYEYPDQQLLATVKLIHSGEIVPGKKITFKGTCYSVGDYIVLSSGAILINNFLKITENTFLVVFKKVNLCQEIVFSPRIEIDLTKSLNCVIKNYNL